MIRNNYLLITVFILILILSACSSVESTVSNELDGIELEITINKQEFSSDDEIIAKVILTNHNDSQRKIYAPIPDDSDEGIAAVMVGRENQNSLQFLSPRNNKDNLNIKGRTFYDFVLLEFGANETIEQEFRWNKELFYPEEDEVVEADSGKYFLSAFIILDEVDNQEDYYEPEKQLISKLNFTVK